MNSTEKFGLITLGVGLVLGAAGWFLSGLLLIFGVVIALAGLFMALGGYFIP